jgi:putative PIN family toxin of toxin-antitoxin system
VNSIHKVVFDTNILFSAAGWEGNPHLAVQAARQGKCLSVTCETILGELEEKLRLKRGLNDQRAAEIVREIRTFSKVVPIPDILKIVTADPDDDPVVECAVVGQAAFIVNGDKHLLALGQHEGIRIVKAADFLTLL